MIGFIFELISSLLPDILDDWIQGKLDRVRNTFLRRFLRILVWLLCAVLEAAIAVALVYGGVMLAVNLGKWFLSLFGFV